MIGAASSVESRAMSFMPNVGAMVRSSDGRIGAALQERLAYLATDGAS
jgi:hypothetical protein